jgi:hypothetical protein
MSELAEELKKFRTGLEGGASDDDFVASVMAACSDERAGERAPSRRRIWPYASVLAAAACAVIGIGFWPRPAGRGTESEGTIAARGALHDGLRATVQGFVGHAAPGAAPPLLEGARLRPGDGILVRYSNPAEQDAYLMVFALDERGSVHWIHPAYLNESTNPTSLKLAREVTNRVLPDVAEPEDAAPGLLRVYALLSHSALDVKSVESKLTGPSPSVADLFPEAEIVEWRCTWTP